MKELDRFAAMAAKARREPVPTVDVTARVLTQLHADQVYVQPQSVDSLATWTAVVSSVLALSILLIALPSWLQMLDPLSEMLEPFGSVLQ